MTHPCDVESWPEAYTEAHPTARKSHRCGECGRVIQPGERYRRASGIWDGEPQTLKQCLHCEAVAEVVNAIDGAYQFGCIVDDIHEIWATRGGLAVGRLCAGIHRQWRGFGGQGLLPVPDVKLYRRARLADGELVEIMEGQDDE